jgi:hypothetical protein
MVEDLIQITPIGVGVMNTAFIERFLAMMKTLTRTSRNQKGFKHNPQSAKGKRAQTLCVLREGTQRKSFLNTYDENPCTRVPAAQCRQKARSSLVRS